MEKDYQECMRYMQNAKNFLKAANKEGVVYNDVKYVRIACGTAYNTVLLALDAYLQKKESGKKAKPKSIEEYKARVTKINKKLLSYLLVAYDNLHLAGYYHGTQSVKTVQTGFDNAMSIINYIK